MGKAKNICPKCGGKLLIEAVGNYGDVFRMTKDGEIAKRRIRRCVYEHSGDYMVYCESCGNSLDASEYGF